MIPSAMNFYTQELGTGVSSLETETNNAETTNSRTYSSISNCCNSTRNSLTNTAERIYSWATSPETQLGFFCIAAGLACGVVSIACGSAYSDCLKTDSKECNKTTTSTHCTTTKGITRCTTKTTSHEDDLLTTSISFAAGSVFLLGAGAYKLCAQ